MADHDRDDDAFLNAYWQADKRAGPKPAPDWMQRVTADALQVQDRYQAKMAGQAKTWGRMTLGAQLFGILGGWRGLGGLIAASIVGVWIGFAPPSSVEDPLLSLLNTQQDVDLFQSGWVDIAYSLEEG